MQAISAILTYIACYLSLYLSECILFGINLLKLVFSTSQTIFSQNSIATVFLAFVEIGIIGLVEEEWLMTLSTVDARDVTYYDFVEVGRKLAAELRSEVCLQYVCLLHSKFPSSKHV